MSQALVIDGQFEFIRKTREDLKANLAFIREKRQMSYRDLGLRAGLPERTVIATVKGEQRARVDTLASVAHALKVSMSDLYLDAESFAKKYEGAGPLAPFVLTSPISSTDSAEDGQNGATRTLLLSRADRHLRLVASN